MRFKKGNLITALVVVVLIVYASVTLVRLTDQIQQAKSERDTIQEQIDAVEAQNAGIEYSIEHKGEAEIVEEIARDKLGLVYPGEQIFYDVSD